MISKIFLRLPRQNLQHSKFNLIRKTFLSSEASKKDDENSIKSVDEKSKPSQIVDKSLFDKLIKKQLNILSQREEKKFLLDKIIYDRKKKEKEYDEKRYRDRQGRPFKNYYEYEERDQKAIMLYEEFFDQSTRKKDLENFLNAIDAFHITNPQKRFYIDFIYGALLKMKEYNAHTSLEAYRKLMEIFPIGPLRCQNLWQIDNMHFPRHQNCAIQILEQMEMNGVLLDEDFARLTIKIFNDWTHVVRKAKRQLYWLPKFKNSNPYPVPSIYKLESMDALDLAFAALERMTLSADIETKLYLNHTNQLKEIEDKKGEMSNDEDTWIVTAQSPKQRDLLAKHNKQVAIYIDGPFSCWIRSKTVEYFLMRTDPLPETAEKLRKIKENDEDNVKDMYNPFANPFDSQSRDKKAPTLSVHELPEGNVYAICCTGTGTKTSVYSWTKFVELNNKCLKDYLIVFRNKDKPKEVLNNKAI